MKHLLASASLAMMLTSAVGVALGADPVNTAQWKDRSSIRVGFHQSIADLGSCMYAALAAANTWNAVEANFYLQVDTVNLMPRVREQTQAYDLDNVTIADDEGAAGTRPTELAHTEVQLNNLKFIIENADIMVPTARIDREEYNCMTIPPGGVLNKRDFQSIMLHEFGHAVGFQVDDDIGEYVDSDACAMFYYIGPGQTRRALCPGEAQEYISAYGYIFDIQSIPTATGPRGTVPIPVEVYYNGTPEFPVELKLELVQCGPGQSCTGDLYTFDSDSPSPLVYPFDCIGTSSNTSTSVWKTTLTDANGVKTRTVQHSVVCTPNN